MEHLENQWHHHLSSVHIPILVGSSKISVKHVFVGICSKLDTRDPLSPQDQADQ